MWLLKETPFKQSTTDSISLLGLVSKHEGSFEVYFVILLEQNGFKKSTLMSTPDKPKGPKLRPGMLSVETTPGVPLSFSGVTPLGVKKKLGVGRIKAL